MARRQLARKPRDPAAPNLKLVPPPKRKRRPRRWKLPFLLTRIRKPNYGSNPVLLAYEEQCVMAVLAKGGASARSMCDAEPERWNRSYLEKTLRRLYDQRRIQRLARRHGRGAIYIVTKIEGRTDGPKR